MSNDSKTTIKSNCPFLFMPKRGVSPVNFGSNFNAQKLFQRSLRSYNISQVFNFCNILNILKLFYSIKAQLG